MPRCNNRNRYFYATAFKQRHLFQTAPAKFATVSRRQYVKIELIVNNQDAVNAGNISGENSETIAAVMQCKYLKPIVKKPKLNSLQIDFIYVAKTEGVVACSLRVLSSVRFRSLKFLAIFDVNVYLFNRILRSQH